MSPFCPLPYGAAPTPLSAALEAGSIGTPSLRRRSAVALAVSNSCLPIAAGSLPWNPGHQLGSPARDSAKLDRILAEVGVAAAPTRRAATNGTAAQRHYRRTSLSRSRMRSYIWQTRRGLKVKAKGRKDTGTEVLYSQLCTLRVAWDKINRIEIQPMRQSKLFTCAPPASGAVGRAVPLVAT